LNDSAFKKAKLSFDFSMEFKDCSPRQAGLIEECKIGNKDLVEAYDEVGNKDLQIVIGSVNSELVANEIDSSDPDD
jgi:hypothetical protein